MTARNLVRNIWRLWIAVCLSVVWLWWGFGSSVVNELTTAQDIQRRIVPLVTELSSTVKHLEEQVIALNEHLNQLELGMKR